MSVLMYVGSIVINFRGRHGSWLLVHHHRVGGVNTASALVGLGASFGNPTTEAILSYIVPRMLNTIWYTTSKLNTGGSSASQKLSLKGVKGDKEIVSTVGLLHLKDILCLI